MCESHFGVVPISPKKDIRKLQLNGRYCELDIYVLTKKILLYRFFSYQYYPTCKNYEFIQDNIILLQTTKSSFALLKQRPLFPKLEMNIVVKSTVHKPTDFFDPDCAI